MKLVRLTFIFVLFLAAHSPAQYSAMPPPPETWLNGASGYARALELQRELNVPLVIYFYTDWCPYCHTLNNRYLPSAEMKDYLSQVVKVRINPELGMAERQLAAQYGVSGYPTFLVKRSASSAAIKVHPFTQNGNLTPAQFAQACARTARVPSRSTARNGRSVEALPASAGKSTPSVTKQERQVGVQITTVKSTTAPSPNFISDGPLPTVGEILVRYIEAIGGRAAQLRLTTRVSKGRVDVPGVSYGGRLESYAMSPNKSLTTMELDGIGFIRQGFDGRVGWEQSDSLGIRTANGAKLAGLARDAEFHGALKLTELYASLKLLGKVKEGFGQAYLVQAAPRVGAPERFYFDIETGLLVRCDIPRPTTSGTVHAEVYFSDWRDVDGVKVPFKRTQSMPGMTFVVTLEEVKHNAALDQAMFRKPAS